VSLAVRGTQIGRDRSLVAAQPKRRSLVLLAEDNADCREMYTEYLVASGFDVVAVETGVQAIEQAHHVRPDIIVMDMAMPEMSGAAATHQLKGDPSFANVPVVALTAYPYSTHKPLSAEVGADSFVQKPCRPDELVALIKRHLGFH
jgi:two-component system cell cycle response regulator DivK